MAIRFLRHKTTILATKTTPVRKTKIPVRKATTPVRETVIPVTKTTTQILKATILVRETTIPATKSTPQILKTTIPVTQNNNSGTQNRWGFLCVKQICVNPLNPRYLCTIRSTDGNCNFLLGINRPFVPVLSIIRICILAVSRRSHGRNVLMEELLKLKERVDIAIEIGESYYREFKSAMEGPPGSKVSRDLREVC